MRTTTMNPVTTRWVRLFVAAFAASIVAPRSAAATPAGIFVSESAAGTVVRLGPGGDLDAAPRFASGLDYPQGLCVGPGGEIYVAERDAGEITIITEGGDFTGAAPWASGTWIPIGLACNGSRVLVVDADGRVVDAGEGGDVDVGGSVFASGLPAPVDLLMRNGIVWVSGDGTFNISNGGDFSGVPPHATGAIGAIDAFDGVRLGGSTTSPRLFDWGAGGDLEAAGPVTTLPGADTDSIDGLLATGDGRLLALVDNRIYDAAPGGDLTGAVAVATGLHGAAAGYEGMLEHLCAYNVECDDRDVCTGTESCAEEACIAGRSLVCDDADACTADACDPVDGCTAVAIPNCCSTDDDCATDEICDVAEHVCVPLIVPDDTDDSGVSTGGSDDDAGATDHGGSAGPTAPGGSSADGTGESSGDTSGAPADGEARGCACGQTDPDASWWWLLGLPLVGRAGRRLSTPARRRRRASLHRT